MLAALLILGILAAGYGKALHFVGSGLPIPLILLPSPRLGELLTQLLFVCIAWGVLNLLPIYPLDGGQIAREVLLRLDSREGIRRSMQLSIFAAAAVAVFWFFQWKTFLVPLMFGYLAYSNFIALKTYRFRGPW